MAAAAPSIDALSEQFSQLSQQDSCSHRHKSRLFVGEGDFTFAVAYLEKHTPTHPDIGTSIVATEYRDLDDFVCNSCETHNSFFESSGPQCDPCKATATRIESHIETLRKQGVTVFHGIDATKLDSYADQFGERHFRCVHWNIPHDGSRKPSDTMPTLMGNFFASCKKIQKPGDHVHVSIPQPPGKGIWYQSGIYGLCDAATNSNYTLVRKRGFVDVSLNPDDYFGSPCKTPKGKVEVSQRYPGYRHMQTARHMPASVVSQGAREYVFKLVDSKEIKPVVLETPVSATCRSDVKKALGLGAHAPNKHHQFRLEAHGRERGTRVYYSGSTARTMPDTDEDSSSCSEAED